MKLRAASRPDSYANIPMFARPVHCRSHCFQAHSALEKPSPTSFPAYGKLLRMPESQPSNKGQGREVSTSTEASAKTAEQLVSKDQELTALQGSSTPRQFCALDILNSFGRGSG